MNKIRINDPNDLEPVTPIPVPELEGYFYIPMEEFNNSIVINKDGRLFDVVKNVKIPVYVHNSGGKKGRVKTNIFRRNLFLHRLLAMTFIGRPSRHLDKPFNKLEVNHIDGNPLNNKLNNLEWVTGKENSLHAHQSRLYSIDTPVQSMNVLTGKITEFHSAKACADFFNIHRATLFKHLRSDNSGLTTKRNNVFRYYSETEWILTDEQIKSLVEFENANSSRTFIVHNEITKDTTIVVGNKELNKIIYVPTVTLWRHLKKFGFYKKDNFTIKQL